ncbi:MAG: glycosyltransferase, partial [Thermomicrobiales bacterium]
PSTPKRRILQVVSSVGVSHGGTASAVTGLSLALQENGHDVAVFSTDAANPGRSRHHRFGFDDTDLPPDAERLDLRISPVRHPYRWLYAPAMKAELRSEAPAADILHINGLFSYPQYAAWSAATKTGTPWVVSTHGQLDPYMRRRGRLQKTIANQIWVRKMLEGARVIHCTTDDERDLIADISPNTRRMVVPNGMDIRRFQRQANPARFREQVLAGSQAPLIVNHGRISRKKGIDLLISALGIVRERFPDAMLAVVGSDAEGLQALLEDQARSLGLGDAVVFTGERSGQELIDAIAAADVWVLPSHTENFGIAVIEAMATGRPVVASRAVNLARGAQAEGALLMIDVSARDAADAIIRLLADDVERDSVAARGQHFAEQFDWSHVVDGYQQMYEAAIRGLEPAGSRRVLSQGST